MQIFSRSMNKLPLVAGTGAAALLVVVVGLVWYYFSPWYTQVGYAPRQPVPYSHRLHVRELGLDCRYCHANVERSPVAMVPPTQTCVNCHQLVKADSPKLAAIRASWEKREPMQWIRVHTLPDYAFFDHATHVNVGVGCAECHGRIDQMDRVRQLKPLSMGWCLECHRDVRAKQGASPYLRPVSELTNMDWVPDPKRPVVLTRRLNPPENCTACHR